VSKFDIPCVLLFEHCKFDDSFGFKYNLASTFCLIFWDNMVLPFHFYFTVNDERFSSSWKKNINITINSEVVGKEKVLNGHNLKCRHDLD